MRAMLGLVGAVALGVAAAGVHGGETDGAVRGYYRFPALRGDTLVFVSEGDLWRVPVGGGVAQRLTTHAGRELYPAISPDGRTVAFAAEYEGPTEVYTLPLAGGRPTRQTYDGADARVVGWTPDGWILYRTRRFATLPDEQVVRLDPKTGDRERLPLAQASEVTVDPESGTVYFTRLPKQSSATKRYRGGWTEQIWRFPTGAIEAEPLTADIEGTTRNPMWERGRVYCVSDRTGTMNLWSMSADGSEARPLTYHRDFDVRSAALDAGRIVYQYGPDLRLYHIETGEDRLVPITLASDLDQERERWVRRPIEYLTAAHLSPNGDRVVLTARGQVFVAPAQQGRLVEAPRNPGVRYRSARFLPGGNSLLALSDESGELEFWRLPANGLGQPERCTTNGHVFRFPGQASPDGKWLAWGDKNRELWTWQIERRKLVRVDLSPEDEITEFSWSPDSQWLAYVFPATNTYLQIRLFRPADGARATVTSDRVNSFSPAWSPDGKWLYFLSDRELRSLTSSPWGPRQPDPFFTETTRIYHVALVKGLRSPFAPRDELHPADIEKTERKPQTTPAPPGATNEPARVKVTIDLPGLASRLEEVPVPPGNYEHLAVTAKHLLWLARDLGFEAKRHLKQLEINRDNPKPKTLVDDVRSYEVSLDNQKLLVRKADVFYAIAVDTAAPAKLDDKKVDLDGWTLSVQPREEWQQIYAESWRMLRDFFYDRGLHGVDWPAMRHKYEPWLERVNDRSELSDVLAEMLGELSTLHHFVRYGDERRGTDQIQTATLGARLVRDRTAGGWRVEHIYHADPDYPRALSPLARPGVEIAEGDTLVQINGRPTLDVPDLGLLLRNQAGRQVLLEVRPRPGAPSRQVIVQPLTAAADEELRYDDWEYSRRLRVEESGGGAIGYVHLRAMGAANIVEWARDFYPVFKRQGLIIDVRHNRGGNIDSWVLGKLLRRAWSYWQPRVGDPYWNMQYAFRGHMVVLCDQHTASDGEAFTEGFRRLGLGPVIGTRTWGGEVWLSSQRWLVDSGMATAAETGVYGPEGAWLIEGHGVDPDRVVDNLPHATFLGQDAQLDAAVKHLQERIAADPRPIPPAPPYPDKSGRPQ